MTDVFEVIKGAKKFKAPEPDGITMEFFKRFCPAIGNLVLDILLEIQVAPYLLSHINKANIILIPKVQGANEATSFRPISLENSIVKIFSKLLANQFAVFMPNLIDNKQVTDVLSRLVTKVAANGIVSGALNNILEGGITHILFADDLLMFSSASEDSLKKFSLLLKSFDLCTGLKMNTLKTKVLHIEGDLAHTESAAGILGYSTGSFPFDYLGLPLQTENLTRADWTKVITKMDSKHASWQGSLLSLAGRLTLMNSVLTSQASYFLSIFKAPVWVTKQIDRRRKTFFWRET
ncbi:hypothetical protein Cni_G09888 [Canna indica]|uniref:Reverse transcriptase domain-containing protein n=1 Tax=Canna indica TaxID=4628 RepID=A0AAQ3K4V4_9LILI|nr:hypothetical protein Cni_G09888 [Canna indica]